MNYEYCDGFTYTIKNGDTLYEISRRHNVPLSLLLRSNPFVDVFNLQVGDTLCIPTKQKPSRPCEVWGDCEQNPDISERPEMPGMPERPGMPGKPEMSGMPERPGMPGRPEMPEKPEPPRPSQPDTEIEWKRRVVKPGDTIGKLLDGKKEYLEAFGDRNGWDNVYLLPGVAYYVPESD